MRYKLLVLCAGIVFLFLFPTTLVLYFCIPPYIRHEINRQIKEYIVLRPGEAEDSFQRFTNDSSEGSADYYTRFYMFNITNLDKVRSEGAKPILEQLGPYTYRTCSEKYDVAFYWNGSISYRERTFYYPEPSLTNGSFDDVVTTLNLALVGVLTRIQETFNTFGLRLAMSSIASTIDGAGSDDKSGLFMRKSVHDLLWGYEDRLLRLLSRFSSTAAAFSLMQNGTDVTGQDPNAISMINSGIYDINKIGQLERWNGQATTENWNNYSEPVHGTAGTFFQPFLSGEEELSIWVPQMYRAMKLKRGSDCKVADIDVYRYFIDSEFWDPDPRYYDQYQGLVNITGNSAGGTTGPALFFSPIDFCGVDSNVSEGVLGVECTTPDAFYVDVEPYTGISLRGAIRFMISSEYSPRFERIDPNLTTTTLPIFTIKEDRFATEKQTEKIRDDLYWALDLRDTLKVVFLVVCIISGILASGIFTLFAKECCVSRRLKRIALENKIEIDPAENQDPLLPELNGNNHSP